MNYCKRCVQPDTRPKIYFQDGVCGACLWEDEKKNVDWGKREQELRDIARWAKDHDGNYDCVIGVSGGKDSTFQAIYSRDTLGLRPLLVSCEPEEITECGKANIENIKQLGFDVFRIRPNPRIMKKLVRRDFFKFLNPMKITEYALWSSAYIVADKFDIPLVIQGENAGLTLGVRDGLGTGGDALQADKGNTLSEDWRAYIGDGITEEDLFLYHYDKQSLLAKGIKAIWLQYYTKEWGQRHNYEFAKARGLKTKKDFGFDPYDEGTYCDYFQLDSPLLPLTQMMKYVKFGFGQCTDHACYDIRDGFMTREEGFGLVHEYDGKCGEKYIKGFCEYIGITQEEFWKEVEKWRVKY